MPQKCLHGAKTSQDESQKFTHLDSVLWHNVVFLTSTWSQSRQFIPGWLLLIICKAAENGMTSMSGTFPKATDRIWHNLHKIMKEKQASLQILVGSHSEIIQDINPLPVTTQCWRLAGRPADQLAVLIVSRYMALHHTGQLSLCVIHSNPSVVLAPLSHRDTTGPFFHM